MGRHSSRASVLRRRVAAVSVLTLLLALLPPLSGWQLRALPRTQVGHLDQLVSGLGLSGSESGTSAVLRAPMAFSMVGFRLPEGADRARVRTSWDGETWTGWTTVERQTASEGPDPGSAESGRAPDRVTEPVWVHRARYLHVSVPGGRIGDVGAALVDSLGLEGGPVDLTATRRAGAEAAGPDIVTREQWGARPYEGSPDYADDVGMLALHHTVTANDYSEAEAPGMVRAIQAYHQNVNGWNDIGYNLLVDRFGNVYEGRAGGLRRAVIGAHAAGWNAGSSGVALLGTHSQVDPSRAATSGLVEALAWKADIHGIDPRARTTRVGDGSPTPTIAGHRDIGATACPGGAAYDDLGGIRAAVARRLGGAPRDDSGLLDRLLDSLL